MFRSAPKQDPGHRRHLQQHHGNTAAGPPRFAITSRTDPLVDPQSAPGHHPPKVGRNQQLWTAAHFCQTKTLTRNKMAQTPVKVWGGLKPKGPKHIYKTNPCHNTAKSETLGEERGDARERKRSGATIDGQRGEQVDIQRGEAAVDVGEKTWGVAFLSATELIRSLPLTQLRSLGYRGRRCGFNKKHQSTKAIKFDGIATKGYSIGHMS